jgi:hypothetical protein
MQIPLSRRRIPATVERIDHTGLGRPELLGKSDREQKLPANTGGIERDPRWIAILLGFRS